MRTGVVFCIFLLCIVPTVSLGQIEPYRPQLHEGGTQSLEDGDETFSLYYGPRILREFYYEPVEKVPFLNYKIKDMGTLGLSTEYMLTDLFGVGCDLLYSKANISYEQVVTSYWPTYSIDRYKYDINATTLSVFVRTNIHFFWIENEDLDVYMLLSLGYRRTRFKTETNDPDFSFNINSYYSYADPTFPVSGNYGFGIRYYFTDMVGANVEIGFGQPHIGAGINIRFAK